MHYCTFFAEVNCEKLIITKGFIIKRKTVLNLRFVVSAKYVTTPLMRLFKLSNIMLLSEGSLCFIPLIKAEDAELIYDTVLKISEKYEEI